MDPPIFHRNQTRRFFYRNRTRLFFAGTTDLLVPNPLTFRQIHRFLSELHPPFFTKPADFLSVIGPNGFYGLSDPVIFHPKRTLMDFKGPLEADIARIAWKHRGFVEIRPMYNICQFSAILARKMS